MKKILYILLTTLTFATAQAQTVKIIKGGEVVAAFDASQFDQVVFAPSASGQLTAEDIAGTYSTMLEVSLIEMPSMGILQTTEATLTITATSADQIKIDLPECVYVMQGNEMTLPAITIDNINIASDGSFSQEYSGVEEATGKAYSGTVSGSVNADGQLNIVETMKYGTMPFTLKMAYTNY